VTSPDWLAVRLFFLAAGMSCVTAQDLNARQVAPSRLEVITDPRAPGIAIDIVGLPISGVSGDDGLVVLAVPPGVAEVRGRTRLGETVTRMIEVRRWSDTVVLVFPGLRTSMASIIVHAPPGTIVEMSGRDPQHIAPNGVIRLDDVVPGTHIVRVQTPGTRDWTTHRVSAGSGEAALLRVPATAPARRRNHDEDVPAADLPLVLREDAEALNTGVVLVEANRPTQVSVGGLILGRAEPGRPLAVRLPAGTEEFALSGDGGDSEIRHVAVEASRMTRLIVNPIAPAAGVAPVSPAVALLLSVGVAAGGAVFAIRVRRRRLRGASDRLRPRIVGGEFASGDFCGPYEVLGLIGRGGMGVVYRARSTEGVIAVKVMDLGMSDQPDLARRFLREGRVLGEMNRRFPDAPIVKVLAYGREHELPTGRPFVAMEYLQGPTLLAEIRDHGRLPVRAACRVVSQIAEALLAAHSCGIYHRDVTPENVVIVGADHLGPVVRVIDFGVARHEYTQLHTVDGSIFGKPAYMAPEQWRGEAVDGRTDLYSLGVVLYVLLTGAAPFSDPSPLAVMRMHEMATVPPLPSGLDPALCRIVMRLLEKDPQDRYQAAESLLEDLHALRQDAAMDSSR
jgi:tRNA A-37 threonylcarbamoyl transferase component Bud32